MLTFRLTGLPDSRLPLYLYCVGTQEEKVLHRPDGFPVYQLFLSHGGEGQFKITGKGTWTMGAGQLFIVEPEVAHEYVPHSKSKGELGYIGIGGASAGSVLQCADLLQNEPYHISGFEIIWSRMTDFWHALDQGATEMWNTSALIYQLILDIAQSKIPSNVYIGGAGSLMAQDGTVTRSNRESDASKDALVRAVALMHTHYQDDLLLKHVADAVGYSVQHLNRLFHQHYGVTGHQYMQRLRLQKASEWLDKHPRASVREAAETVGMEVNYFIRMFKREFGETPGKGIKHRNQLQMEKDLTNS
ncbi:AraC-like DNA-binding protein [Paenibacillus sp. W4I10]|uniref:AraC family transcriptional regulator n=1 Tax=Paenibacillus sp. W4I10 TaxID=3042298 RepID=UPI002789652D|nr:AraC family transcriptional regulator [Paenibacillus sp. W4I10]MDQ0722735.1 AraC-like DNA-binding protein [Paenibacillus sp. W4I10]